MICQADRLQILDGDHDDHVVRSQGINNFLIKNVKIPMYTIFSAAYHLECKSGIFHNFHGGHLGIQNGGRLSGRIDGGRQYSNSGYQYPVMYQFSVPHAT